MANVRQNCRVLEKHKYWTEFQSTRHKFFKIMIGLFQTQLRIPRKFMSNFKEKLPATINLTGPSGSVWTVRLLTTDEDVLFLDGWEEFVKDHSLAEEDFLVFSYSGNSTFEVMIFDRSGCEREGAYFVKMHTRSCSKRKCAMELDEVQDSVRKSLGGNAHPQAKGMKKRRIHNASQVDVLEKFNPNEEDSEEFVDADQKPNHNKGKHRMDEDEMDITLKLSHFHPFKSGGKKRGGAQSSKSVQLKDKSENKDNMESPLKKHWYSYYHISNRREVTEEEKQRAHKLAILYSPTVPHLLVTMKPTYVYKYFSVNIPREWANKHVSTKDLEIQLRVPSSNKEWIVRFQNSVWKCALTRGWSKFVMDNNLEEHDVCIFELNQGGKANKKTVIWDVIIFRVVDELVPLRRSLYPN